MESSTDRAFFSFLTNLVCTAIFMLGMYVALTGCSRFTQTKLLVPCFVIGVGSQELSLKFGFSLVQTIKEFAEQIDFKFISVAYADPNVPDQISRNRLAVWGTAHMEIISCTTTFNLFITWNILFCHNEIGSL